MMNKYYHPDSNLLDQYVTGELKPGVASLLSPHLEHCEKCLSYVENKTNEKAALLNKVTLDNDINIDVDKYFDEIKDLLDEKITDAHVQKEQESGPVLSFQDKNFVLPKVLSFALKDPLNWKEFGKNSRIAPVLTTEKGNLYFIYLDANEKIPSHRHESVEYSYVVAGSYESNGHKLQTGDFSTFDKNDEHAPMAVSEDGCLVVSWVEKRLNFFSGIFSPLNRLLWWYLHKA